MHMYVLLVSIMFLSSGWSWEELKGNFQNTAVVQQSFFSVGVISFLERVILYIEHILHRYIPKASGKPSLHLKIWLQTMETLEFLVVKMFLHYSQ